MSTCIVQDIIDDVKEDVKDMKDVVDVKEVVDVVEVVEVVQPAAVVVAQQPTRTQVRVPASVGAPTPPPQTSSEAWWAERFGQSQ